MRCYGSRLYKSWRTCTKHSSMETPTVQVAIKLHQNIRKITLILQKNHKGNTTRLTIKSTLESPVTLNILVFAPQDKHKIPGENPQRHGEHAKIYSQTQVLFANHEGTMSLFSKYTTTHQH